MCSYALPVLMGMTHNAWVQIWKTAKSKQPIEHGFVGKAGNKTKMKHVYALRSFFEEIRGFCMSWCNKAWPKPSSRRSFHSALRWRWKFTAVANLFHQTKWYTWFPLQQGWSFNLTTMEESLGSLQQWTMMTLLAHQSGQPFVILFKALPQACCFQCCLRYLQGVRATCQPTQVCSNTAHSGVFCNTRVVDADDVPWWCGATTDRRWLTARSKYNKCKQMRQ